MAVKGATSKPVQTPRPSASSGSGGWKKSPSFEQAKAGTYIKRGQAGASVSELQKQIGMKDVDGKFGPKTKQAVKDFQRQHGCKVDGIVGPETLGAIDKAKQAKAAASTRAADAVEPSQAGQKRSAAARATGQDAPSAAAPAGPKAARPGQTKAADLTRADTARLAKTTDGKTAPPPSTTGSGAAATPPTSKPKPKVKAGLLNDGKPLGGPNAGKYTAGMSLGHGTVADALAKKDPSLKTYNKVAGTALSFVGHFLGDDPVAKTGAGHTALSALKTVGDYFIGKAGNLSGALAPAAKAFTGGPWKWVAAADAFLKTDNPAKLATATASELIPASQAGKAISGGVDAMAPLVNLARGKTSTAFKQAEPVEGNALDGKYGAPAQAGTMAVGLLTDRKATEKKITDNKAATGERGIFVAWGNAAGDMWADVLGKSKPRGTTKVYTNFDAYKKKMDAMKWYKPWTW